MKQSLKGQGGGVGTKKCVGECGIHTQVLK